MIDEQSHFPLVINTSTREVLLRAGGDIVLIQGFRRGWESHQTEGEGSHLSKHTLNIHDIINGFFGKMRQND